MLEKTPQENKNFPGFFPLIDINEKLLSKLKHSFRKLLLLSEKNFETLMLHVREINQNSNFLNRTLSILEK